MRHVLGNLGSTGTFSEVFLTTLRYIENEMEYETNFSTSGSNCLHMLLREGEAARTLALPHVGRYL